jgi:hypothetical protein
MTYHLNPEFELIKTAAVFPDLLTQEPGNRSHHYFKVSP